MLNIVSLGSFFIDAFFPRFCVSCKKEGELLCEICKQRWIVKPRSVSARHFSSYVYADPIARNLLRTWKYHFDVKGLEYLKEHIWNQADLIRQFVHIHNVEVIVPVPLHYQRLAWRGFNQATALANCIGELTDIPVRHWLKRRWPTPQSARIEKRARKQFLKDSFVFTGEQGYKILLIDDVWTTGNTLKSCASVCDKKPVFYTLMVNI